MDYRASTTPRDLESMLFDESIEPKALPLSLLEHITNGFSNDHEIGRGGFGVVYKGILENANVAVKKLSNAYMYEEEFYRELESLMKVKHKNIVRFLGYCVDTQGRAESYNGKFVMVDVHQRLLCFEYLPNGSLADYITDSSAGLEWRMRYKIIKGVCEGLNYLHRNHIVHFDLKPANILMDENMVPKISDFGLSMCFQDKGTQVLLTKMGGTIGYLAPEFFASGGITSKFDLYSLGVIIIEILTGKKGYEVQNVLESWSNRSHISQREQLRVCTEIGIECSSFNPAKRPDSEDIINRLEKAETMQEVMAGENCTRRQEMIYPSKAIQGFSGPLDVRPLGLRFPFEHNKSIPCLLNLKNNTDGHVAFRLNEKSQRFLILPIYGLISPRSTQSLLVVAHRRSTFSEKSRFLIMHSIIISNDDFVDLFTGDYEELWKHVIESGKMVHEVIVEVVYTPKGETSYEEAIPRGIKIISMMDNLGHLLSVDTNTNKPWVAIRRSGQAQKATIVDYVTQEQTGTLEATTWGAASSPKFFAQEEWIMAPSPDDDGHIHIYNYKMENIDAFKVGRYAVTNLAVHPTKLSLLSMCWASNEIKLWVCDDGWKLSQTFISEKTVNKVVFNPKDTDINGFAISCDDHTVELWDLDSSECSCTLSGHQDELNCLEFFTREDQQQYLITGSNDKTAKIWDIQTMTCVHTLEGFMSPVMCVFGHPKLPVLITGTEDGIIHLWSSTDFRLKKILNMGSCGEVLSLSLACPVESRRVFARQHPSWILADMDGKKNEYKDKESAMKNLQPSENDPLIM